MCLHSCGLVDSSPPPGETTFLALPSYRGGKLSLPLPSSSPSQECQVLGCVRAAHGLGLTARPAIPSPPWPSTHDTGRARGDTAKLPCFVPLFPVCLLRNVHWLKPQAYPGTSRSFYIIKSDCPTVTCNCGKQSSFVSRTCRFLQELKCLSDSVLFSLPENSLLNPQEVLYKEEGRERKGVPRWALTHPGSQQRLTILQVPLRVFQASMPMGLYLAGPGQSFLREITASLFRLWLYRLRPIYPVGWQ